MPLPPDVSTRLVHGDWSALTGEPRAGRVTFQASTPRLTHVGTYTTITGTPISATLDADGEVLVELPCTNDPELVGGPFTYLVTVVLKQLGSQVDEAPYSFSIEVPDEPGTLELATVTPTGPITPGTVLVTSVNGKSGAVTLTADDIGGLGGLPWLDAASYGAVGDGTADDTEAILEALAAAEPGQSVLLTGTHATSAPLRIPPQVTLRGLHGGHIRDLSAPTLYPLDTFVGGAVLELVDQETGGYAVPHTDARIVDLSIEGSRLPAGVDGVSAVGMVHGVYFETVMIRHMPGDGVVLAGNASGKPYSWHAVQLHVSDIDGNGIDASMTDATWIDCEALGCAGDGWVINGPAANSALLGCRSEWSGRYGWYISGSTGTGQGSGGYTLIGCSTDRNGAHGVYITARGNGPISLVGCVLRRDGRTSTSGGYAALRADGATAPILMSGCTVYPGQDDQGTGNASPQYAISATNASILTYSDCHLHAITATVNDGGGNGAFLRGGAVTERTGPSGSPTAVTRGLRSSPDGSVLIQSGAAGTIPLQLRAASGQTADLMRLVSGSGTTIAYFDANGILFSTSQIRAQGGIQVGGISNTYGGAVGGLGITNATTPPSSAPTGGGVLYAEGGALKWRGPTTTTTIAPA